MGCKSASRGPMWRKANESVFIKRKNWDILKGCTKIGFILKAGRRFVPDF
jgi:hypothetical protein